MAFRIQGLSPTRFRPMLSMDESQLAALRAARVTAGDGGYPCRVSLVDAEKGEPLLLVHHVSNDVDNPYRSSFAIFVREAASRDAGPAVHVDEVPEMLDRRTLGLRGLDGEGRLLSAALALPGKTDAAIRDLLLCPDIAAIHAHNAAHGCFLARIERH